MSADRIAAARELLRRGGATPHVDDLARTDLDHLDWSGDRLHLASIARQLDRVVAGEVEYLVVRLDGRPYAKAGIDFVADPAAGTIWQVATHPDLRGIGLASALLAAAEERTLRRGRHRTRLSVEPDNGSAVRLYERLGYRPTGTATESWPTLDESGREYEYTTEVVLMEKLLGPGSA